MSSETNLVTVYRSMDADAKENCEEIIEILEDAGLEAVLLDDTAPGVPEGVFEVQVPPASVPAAEKLIADNPLPEEGEELDDSDDLNLESIASAATEMEANSIKSFLDSNGIAAVIVGDSVLPNLNFEVRVARDQAEQARQLVSDAAKHGADDAQAAELESESGS